MISIQVLGAQAMAARLARAAVAADRAMPSALDQAALLVARSAKIKAPVDTGFLRAAIKASRVSAKEADVTAHAEYSIYQELGTYKMAAHPFMRPALDENREQIKALIGRQAIFAISGAMA